MSDIKHAYPLILNKVAPPHYATPVLRRARLIDWMNGAANCRVVVVAADAGYGKTTLLWQWERDVDFPCYWYKLDRNDRDWSVHLSYLIAAIAQRHKGFGQRAHSMLRQMGGQASSRPGAAAYLLAEMHQRLTEPCTFIIDDWQYVNAVTEVRSLWNQILRDAPPTCRFVFSSRTKPRLQFARLKTHAGYAEVNTDALRFTEAEIGELFRDIYNDPLNPTELTELEHRTEGWAASLQLVEVSLRERPTPDGRREFIGSIPAKTDSALFDFLAEEVLDQQPDETRNFLLSTSILQQITPEIAERLAGIHDGRRELIDLETRGLFTNRLDEERYRYHGLFREFLERRLVSERSESEVLGLHIHAASYFETTAQWPEAIHHYLRAGLQRQAARLIAKHGEDVVTDGGLGLVDEWLRELPGESIKGNARLSLLYGEVCGIRGDWDEAVAALQRARNYFARKGDRRFEALACLKLSTIHNSEGDTERAAELAQAALGLVPEDATATRLRIEGNLAVTQGWNSGPMESVVLECKRIAADATRLGLDHIAAIAHHNAGAALRQIGRSIDAIDQLERARLFWADSPTSPFGDNHELVLCLLAAGDGGRARALALEGIRKTSAWRKPLSDAELAYGSVLAYEGHFHEAIAQFSKVLAAGVAAGAAHAPTSALVIECLYLGGRGEAEIQAMGDVLSSLPPDLNPQSELFTAAAIVKHSTGECRGQCQEFLRPLDEYQRRGSLAIAATGRVKIGALAMKHRQSRPKIEAWRALVEAVGLGLTRSLKWWLRDYASQPALIATRGLPILPAICTIAEMDPDGWRNALIELLGESHPDQRPLILTTLKRIANRGLVSRLRSVGGSDVAELRQQLVYVQAQRLHVRTFGRLAVHRGTWTGPEVPIDKKRVRALVAYLAAHHTESISRDVLVDALWPDADGDSAINSLNQAVFQLRRYFDTEYRAGTSPEYVLSNLERVALNRELVRVDFDELLGLADQLGALEPNQRNRTAHRLLDFVRGDYLSDFRYEDWATVRHTVAAITLRRALLPIATGDTGMLDSEVRLRAATALLRLDPYDEKAVIAMASAMALSGKRVAARELVARYAERIRAEMDDEPSIELTSTMNRLGVGT